MSWIHVRYAAAETQLERSHHRCRTDGYVWRALPVQGLIRGTHPYPYPRGFEPFEGAPTSAALCRKKMAYMSWIHV
eukprot:2868122-Heterocapsa_arctica.AAC.1